MRKPFFVPVGERPLNLRTLLDSYAHRAQPGQMIGVVVQQTLGGGTAVPHHCRRKLHFLFTGLKKTNWVASRPLRSRRCWASLRINKLVRLREGSRCLHPWHWLSGLTWLSRPIWGLCRSSASTGTIFRLCLSKQMVLKGRNQYPASRASRCEAEQHDECFLII